MSFNCSFSDIQTAVVLARPLVANGRKRLYVLLERECLTTICLPVGFHVVIELLDGVKVLLGPLVFFAFLSKTLLQLTHLMLVFLE